MLLKMAKLVLHNFNIYTHTHTHTPPPKMVTNSLLLLPSGLDSCQVLTDKIWLKQHRVTFMQVLKRSCKLRPLPNGMQRAPRCEERPRGKSTPLSGLLPPSRFRPQEEGLFDHQPQLSLPAAESPVDHPGDQAQSSQSQATAL